MVGCTSHVNDTEGPVTVKYSAGRSVLPADDQRWNEDAALKQCESETKVGWLGGITVRESDWRSSGCGFDFRLGCYPAT